MKTSAGARTGYVEPEPEPEPRVIARLYLPLDMRAVAEILRALADWYPDARLTDGSPDGIVEIAAVAE